MSVAVPLAVHIGNTHLHRAITANVRDLSFRKTIPGGYASATVDLNRPLSELSREIAPYAAVEFSDARHGGMVWEGRLEDPGRSSGASGSRLSISALGPSASFGDVNRTYIGIDSSADSWTRLAGSVPPHENVSWSIETSSAFGNNGPAILHAVPEGTSLVNNTLMAGSDYLPIRFSGQAIGSVRITFISGVTDPNYHFHVSLTTGPPVVDITASTSAQAVDLREGVDWSGNMDAVAYHWGRGGATVSAGVENWFRQNTFVVKPRLTNRAGTVFTSTNTLSTNATEIIEDLLGGSGRIPLIDAASAAIAANVNDIKHLIYLDGVTAQKILDDLMLLEPNRYYAAWEKTGNGKHRFEWAAWPTSVRYEVSVVDGFDCPGSTAELWNEVLVRYRDAGGFIRNRRRTQSVPALTALGITRAAILDLGDNAVTSAADADAAGDQFLAQHRYPTGGGTVRISRPIMDRTRGRMVLPHEIEPGSLLAVMDADVASGNTITASEEDGVTVFRVMAVDYRMSNNTAELSLSEHARTGAQGVSDLAKSQIKRRR